MKPYYIVLIIFIIFIPIAWVFLEKPPLVNIGILIGYLYARFVITHENWSKQ